MSDTVEAKVRSRIMSQIRGKDTKPEMRLRRALFARGLRYRLHKRGLPGRPDIAFPTEHVAVFVHGCFWHGCPEHYSPPKSRKSFWRKKLHDNRRRDRRKVEELEEQGWRVVVIWEHEIEDDVAACSKRVERIVLDRRRH